MVVLSLKTFKKTSKLFHYNYNFRENLIKKREFLSMQYVCFWLNDLGLTWTSQGWFMVSSMIWECSKRKHEKCEKEFTCSVSQICLFDQWPRNSEHIVSCFFKTSSLKHSLHEISDQTRLERVEGLSGALREIERKTEPKLCMSKGG